MRRNLMVIIVSCLALSFVVLGCSQKKAASSKEAIDAAKVMQTVQQKTDYLIGQAKAFYNSKDFQSAVDLAQYVLAYVDKDSQEAKNLLEKAKQALTAKAEEAVNKVSGDLKKTIGSFGK